MMRKATARRFLSGHTQKATGYITDLAKDLALSRY